MTQPTLLVLHVCLSLIYFMSLMLRIAAIIKTGDWKARRPLQPLGEMRDLPVYTVLVALYREREVLPQLIAALQRIRWPRARLDIKLVCEADDRETIDALRLMKPGPQFEIVEVPPIGPRTKPKALAYALPAARGEFLVIYDAEDRPHPDQLREACQAFRSLPDDVACLQAPLIITNARQSWISALFSLEYSALFRALLPTLACYRMPLPLGGTSNHFRTGALRRAGGWDPYNVTEDADIGMRLHRLGYRSDVLQRQTLEDAPVDAKVWRAQRTRWFKGWLQTWLVLMRDPHKLYREFGFGAFAAFHLTIGGMLLSALAHPFILIFLSMTLIAMAAPASGNIPPLDLALIVIDLVNILGSYTIFLTLGVLAMSEHEKKQIGWRSAAVPIYWLMMSWAAWRAVYDLYRRPFHWNKTPHSISRN